MSSILPFSRSTLCSWEVDMRWFCSVCEKSLSRKDSMQRHVMTKQRKACLTPFQTVAIPSKKYQRFRFEHPFTCKKDCMGSIFIAASFRGNFPSPGEDSLVLFTMATCVYKNASGHAIHWICERNSYGFGVGVLFWRERKEFDCVWWSDDLRQQRQSNCEPLYSWFSHSRIVNLFTLGSHHRNLSVIYIV